MVQNSQVGKREGLLERLVKKWKEEPVAIFSFIVALVSLSVSAGSFYTSRESFQQTLQQYNEERSIIFTGKFGKSTDSLALVSVDPNFNFLGGSIFFPTAIHKGPLDIQDNGEVRGMGTLDYELNSYLFKIRPPIAGYTSILELGIPVFIQCAYTTKGRRYYDWSLYQLKYQGILSEDKSAPFGTKFIGLALMARFSPRDELPNLDELLKASVTQIEGSQNSGGAR